MQTYALFSKLGHFRAILQERLSKFSAKSLMEMSSNVDNMHGAF
jgi:hypothetical protein